MAYYLNAVIGNENVPATIAQAMKFAQTGYFQRDDDGLELGLGWMITPLNQVTDYEKLLQAPEHFNLDIAKPVHKIENPKYNQRAIIDKLGATDGFRSYIGVIPEKKIGIVILTNKYTQNTGALQNLGRKILFSIFNYKEV